MKIKWYLRIVGISIVLISINLVMNAVPVLTSLRDSFFTVSLSLRLLVSLRLYLSNGQCFLS